LHVSVNSNHDRSHQPLCPTQNLIFGYSIKLQFLHAVISTMVIHKQVVCAANKTTGLVRFVCAFFYILIL